MLQRHPVGNDMQHLIHSDEASKLFVVSVACLTYEHNSCAHVACQAGYVCALRQPKLSLHGTLGKSATIHTLLHALSKLQLAFAGSTFHGADGLQTEERCTGNSQPILFLIRLACAVSRSVNSTVLAGSTAIFHCSHTIVPVADS